MSRWRDFLDNYDLKKTKVEKLKLAALENADHYGVYPGSIHQIGNATIMMVRDDTQKFLVSVGEDNRLMELKGTQTVVKGAKLKICPLTNENCKVIRRIFAFMNPQIHKGSKITIGLGDRLGLASPGHIQTVSGLDAFPVLAQQSIRELNLTGRTYEDVISAAAWAVLEEGYTKGYGADGDHLKTSEEVKMALDVGMTMITLDCSEHIDNAAASEPLDALMAKYEHFSQEERDLWENRYMNRDVEIEGFHFTISHEDIIRMACVYGKAIGHAMDVFHNLIKGCGRPIDFEMSIDETLTSTSPASHYFVASELITGGVDVTSLAPRFCGEFQKGIDYRGDVEQFTQEFIIHVAIANHFGYKISVHSGSDKFMVFPIIGEKTGGNYHLKTAGTNWLEAVRVIAAYKPDLYRRIHAYAIQNLEQAKQYYHISGKPENVPALEELQDKDLPELMNRDDSRQILHITYGLILQATDEKGDYLFRNEFYQALHTYERQYTDALKKHIGKHLQLLGM